MQNQSIEYLAARVRDLEQQLQLHKDRITTLESQNEQLMGVVVQASHHSVKDAQEFVNKVEKLVKKKVETSSYLI